MTSDGNHHETRSTDNNRISMLNLLFQKLSFAISLGGENGAAANEVRRQIREISRSQGGDPVSGVGITKSFDEE